MHFYEGPDHFRTVLLLLTFLTAFEPFLPATGAIWGHFGTKRGSFLGDFGPFWGRSGVILGSPRDHFGIVLVSF